MTPSDGSGQPRRVLICVVRGAPPGAYRWLGVATQALHLWWVVPDQDSVQLSFDVSSKEIANYGRDVELTNITFHGPEIDDFEILGELPESLSRLLRSLNGFIQFGGGLHVRGACRNPQWHSLRHAWHGPEAFHNLFSSVDPTWIPFAEDCVGDQFMIANNELLFLSAETGDVEPLGFDLVKFLELVDSDPVGFLSMEPLLQFQQDKNVLQAGQLIHAYPPFCTKEAAGGVSLAAVPASELNMFHSTFASQIPEMGRPFQVIVTDQENGPNK